MRGFRLLDFKVTLRVSSKNDTLSDLIKNLGEPTKGFSIDDLYSKGKRKREFTLWSLESSKQPSDDFDSHLGDILNFLDRRSSCISKLSCNCEMDLFCMFSSDNGQGGAVLSAATIKKLSSYELDLVFDVYAEND